MDSVNTSNSNKSVGSLEPPYSMFEIIVPPEYRSFIEDLSRMVMVQVMANFLFFASNPTKYHFFNADFLKSLMFIIVGVACYWLVLRRIVSFGPNLGYSESKFWYGGGN